MRDTYHPRRDDLSLPTVLNALSDPIRLRIVQVLADGAERACGAFRLPVAKNTGSHHLKVLRESGVIAVRAEGTLRLSSLRRADLDARFPGLLDAVVQAAQSASLFPTGSLNGINDQG